MLARDEHVVVDLDGLDRVLRVHPFVAVLHLAVGVDEEFGAPARILQRLAGRGVDGLLVDVDVVALVGVEGRRAFALHVDRVVGWLDVPVAPVGVVVAGPGPAARGRDHAEDRRRRERWDPSRARHPHPSFGHRRVAAVGDRQRLAGFRVAQRATGRAAVGSARARAGLRLSGRRVARGRGRRARSVPSRARRIERRQRADRGGVHPLVVVPDVPVRTSGHRPSFVTSGSPVLRPRGQSRRLSNARRPVVAQPVPGGASAGGCLLASGSYRASGLLRRRRLIAARRAVPAAATATAVARCHHRHHHHRRRRSHSHSHSHCRHCHLCRHHRRSPGRISLGWSSRSVC